MYSNGGEHGTFNDTRVEACNSMKSGVWSPDKVKGLPQTRKQWAELNKLEFRKGI